MKYVYSGISRRLDILNKIAKNKFKSSGSILLVDGLNLFLRSYVAVKNFNLNGEHIGGLIGSINSLRKLINDLNPSKVLIIFDGKNGANERRKIDENYKIGRSGLSNLSRIHKWADEKTQEENIINQLNRFLDYLNYIPVFSFIQDEAEADDVISFLATEMYKNQKVIIASSDKDYLQLINDKISVYSTVKKKMYDIETFINEYEMIPKNYIYLKVIDGDSSDNVPGIKGLGVKTLFKLSPEIKDNPEYNLDNLFSVIENKYKSKEDKDLFIIRERIKQNYKLMQLSETLLNNTQQLNIINQLTDFKVPVLNIKVLTMLLNQDGISDLAKQKSWWIPFQNLNTDISFNLKRSML